MTQYTNMRSFLQTMLDTLDSEGKIKVAAGVDSEAIATAIATALADLSVDISTADMQELAAEIASALAGLTVDISLADIETISTQIATDLAAEYLSTYGYGWDYNAATPIWRKIGVDSSGNIKTKELVYAPNSTEADQALTVSSVAVQLSAFHANTTHVLMTLHSASIRYTLDGSTPTSSNGHRMDFGAERVWSVEMAAAAKFIREGSGDAVLHVSQLKRA